MTSVGSVSLNRPCIFFIEKIRIKLVVVINRLLHFVRIAGTVSKR